MTGAEMLNSAVPTCVATVGALPATGGDSSAFVWWAHAAIVIIGVGAIALLVRRRALAAGAIAVLAAVVIVGASLTAPPAAHADTGTVTYEGDCTLIRIDPTSVHRAHPETLGSLLPGDSVTAVTVDVRNSSDFDISLTADVDLDPATFDGALEIATLVDGAAGPVDLPPGEHVTVTLNVRLADHAGDALQGRSSPLPLVLTAMQR